MNRILIFLFLFLNLSLFGQMGKLVNKVVAQVGDNIILLSDLEQQQIQAKQSEMEVGHAFSCSVLEQLMVQELLVNQAKLDSILVSDEQVDAEMENRLRVIEKQMGGREKLEAFYEKTTAQIKNEFRDIANIETQMVTFNTSLSYPKFNKNDEPIRWLNIDIKGIIESQR